MRQGTCPSSGQRCVPVPGENSVPVTGEAQVSLRAPPSPAQQWDEAAPQPREAAESQRTTSHTGPPSRSPEHAAEKILTLMHACDETSFKKKGTERLSKQINGREKTDFPGENP